MQHISHSSYTFFKPLFNHEATPLRNHTKLLDKNNASRKPINNGNPRRRVLAVPGLHVDQQGGLVLRELWVSAVGGGLRYLS